ncbi:FAD-dependent monooxygenase [Streptomyces sp. NPDC089919]|uniref:FAD-dependent monooxygenase n=1 Tax=Streptomyces sp. NPDC089919 TaxID=3155188 RepID=UPI00343D3F82
MTSKIRTVLVIGGGIAGSTAAMALQKAGIEATIYETWETTAVGIGGEIRLAPNGMDALDAIGAGDTIREIARPMRGTLLHSADGTPLGEIDSPDHLPAWQAVRRDELQRRLFEEATRRGIKTVPGKRLVDAVETADGVTAYFADGTEASADLLLGADGIRSTVRGLIDPDAPQPEYAGLLGFAAPVQGDGFEPTGGKLYMYYGKVAAFGYMVAPDTKAQWFINLPHPELVTVAEAMETGNAYWLEKLTAAVADDASPALEMLRRTDAADLLITGPLETMPALNCWSRGRMVLSGDAVHATSPSAGQGASLAMESGVQLARCLRDLPYQEAFVAYEGLRRGRVERIIEEARGTNRSKANPAERKLSDLKPADTDWQFTHHIDWDAPAVTESSVAA